MTVNGSEPVSAEDLALAFGTGGGSLRESGTDPSAWTI